MLTISGNIKLGPRTLSIYYNMFEDWAAVEGMRFSNDFTRMRGEQYTANHRQWTCNLYDELWIDSQSERVKIDFDTGSGHLGHGYVIISWKVMRDMFIYPCPRYLFQHHRLSIFVQLPGFLCYLAEPPHASIVKSIHYFWTKLRWRICFRHNSTSYSIYCICRIIYYNILGWACIYLFNLW